MRQRHQSPANKNSPRPILITIMILIKDDQKLYLVSAVGLVFARKDKNPLGLEIGCAIAHYIITSSPVDWNNKELNYSTPTSPFLCQKKKMP